MQMDSACKIAADCHFQFFFKAVLHLDYLVFLIVPVPGKLSAFFTVNTTYFFQLKATLPSS